MTMNIITTFSFTAAGKPIIIGDLHKSFSYALTKPFFYLEGFMQNIKRVDTL